MIGNGRFKQVVSSTNISKNSQDRISSVNREFFFQDGKKCRSFQLKRKEHPLSERLDIPLKSLNTIVLRWCKGCQGAFNWDPMMPRDASLTDTSDRCCFFTSLTAVGHRVIIYRPKTHIIYRDKTHYLQSYVKTHIIYIPRSPIYAS